MNEILTRIRKIFNTSDKTQTEIGKLINKTPQYVWRILNIDNINPSKSTIKDICREFNINEDWLRYGTEPMKKIINENDTEYIKGLVSEDNPFFDIIKGIIKTYNSLDKKSQEILQDFSENLLKELNTTSSKENAKKSLETAVKEQTSVTAEKAEEEYIKNCSKLVKKQENNEKPANKKNLEELSDEEQIELYRQELKHEREVKEKSEALRKSG